MKFTCTLFVLFCATATFAQAPPPPPGVRDVLLQFKATDGTPLEARLSLPAGAKGPVPVVFYLHGAGARNFKHPVRYRAADGQIQAVNFYDYFAREHARRGVAFFVMSKRGCTIGADGLSQVDRPTFSKATSSVLLDDYTVALDALRARSEIDPARIILSGASEGTRLAPQLALRSPAGIIGLVLSSYQPDNIQDTVTWQNTIGPWRAIASMIPGAKPEARTRAEYDAALKTNAALAQQAPFAAFDTDKDGVMTQSEVLTLIKPRLTVILKAIEDGNDDFIWQNMVNLSSAYLRDGWTGPPTSAYLLKLNVPIGIFHGDLDGTTRVEGVHETSAAFKAAGKTNLTITTYPEFEHNLGWTPQGAAGDGPKPYQDAFDFTAALALKKK